MLKIQLCLHRNKLHFKIYSNRKQFILIVIIFHNFTVFTLLSDTDPEVLNSNI